MHIVNVNTEMRDLLRYCELDIFCNYNNDITVMARVRDDVRDDNIRIRNRTFEGTAAMWHQAIRMAYRELKDYLREGEKEESKL